MRAIFVATAATLMLAACETPTTQRYAISVENNQAIKALGASGIGVSTFAPPSDFSPSCRALGSLQVADGLSHTQYIQKAFEDELKIAGVYSSAGAKTTLSGKVEKLEFSSTRAITGGSWTIDLALTSSKAGVLKSRSIMSSTADSLLQKRVETQLKRFQGLCRIWLAGLSRIHLSKISSIDIAGRFREVKRL